MFKKKLVNILPFVWIMFPEEMIILDIDYKEITTFDYIVYYPILSTSPEDRH